MQLHNKYIFTARLYKQTLNQQKLLKLCLNNETKDQSDKLLVNTFQLNNDFICYILVLKPNKKTKFKQIFLSWFPESKSLFDRLKIFNCVDLFQFLF